MPALYNNYKKNLMKKIHKLLMMFAAMGIFAPVSYDLTPDEIEYYKSLKLQKEIDFKKKQGLKVFDIDGFKVWALNEKNAIRKVNNLKKLLSVAEQPK